MSTTVAGVEKAKFDWEYLNRRMLEVQWKIGQLENNPTYENDTDIQNLRSQLLIVDSEKSSTEGKISKAEAEVAKADEKAQRTLAKTLEAQNQTIYEQQEKDFTEKLGGIIENLFGEGDLENLSKEEVYVKLRNAEIVDIKKTVDLVGQAVDERIEVLRSQNRFSEIEELKAAKEELNEESGKYMENQKITGHMDAKIYTSYKGDFEAFEAFMALQTTISNNIDFDECETNNINPDDIIAYHLTENPENFGIAIRGLEAALKVLPDMTEVIQGQKKELIETAQKQSWYQEFLAKQEQEEQAKQQEEQAKQQPSQALQSIFQGLSYSQLNALQKTLTEKLGGQENISFQNLQSVLEKDVPEASINLATPGTEISQDGSIMLSDIQQAIESSLDQPPQPQEPNQEPTTQTNDNAPPTTAVETRLKETNTKDPVQEARGGLKGVELQVEQTPGNVAPTNITPNVRMPANYAPAPAQQGKTGP